MTTTITIPDTRATSLNEIWRQGFWRKRQQLALSWRSIVRSAIDPETVRLYDVPVHVTITACYRSRPVDCDNLLAKPLVDAIKGWYIRDDDPRYVASVRLISRKSDSDHITITLDPETETTA